MPELPGNQGSAAAYLKPPAVLASPLPLRPLSTLRALLKADEHSACPGTALGCFLLP